MYNEPFGNLQNTQKAVANRGWYLANWILLGHPKINTKNLCIMLVFNDTKVNERVTNNKEDICNAVDIYNKLSSTILI